MQRVICWQLAAVATLLFLSCPPVFGEQVIVVPLGGAVGDATPSEVLKGKTFSSAKGKGLTGTLELNPEFTGDAEPSDVLAGKTFSNDTGTGLTGTLETAGMIVHTNSIGMEFVYIPKGSFYMGSPDTELGRYSHETLHGVILTKPFYMQTTEVTQEQWEQVMGGNPSSFSSCGPTCPVEMVSWDDVQNFIDTLNSQEGRFPCHIAPYCYTLPTEAQWEYAARAGTITAFYNGGVTATDCSLDANLDEIGWYCGNANRTPHPVGQKEPNPWGLYDMLGNVCEWCSDWYADFSSGVVTDPTGGVTGSMRVIRGGTWNSIARNARSASRTIGSPGNRVSYIGFRLVLPPGQ